MSEPAERIYDIIYHNRRGTSIDSLRMSTGWLLEEVKTAVSTGIELGWMRQVGVNVHLVLTNGERMFPGKVFREPDDGAYQPTPEEIAEHCREFKSKAMPGYEEDVA